MRSRIRLLLTGLVVAVGATAGILVACTDSPDLTSVGCKGANCANAGGDASDDTPPTAESVCAEEAAAYCDESARCSPFGFKVRYPDRAACIARRKIWCEVGLTAPGTSLTPTRLAECARGRATIACEDVFAGKAPEACAPLGGAIDDGKPCVDSAQCKNRLCRFSSGACGVCAKLVGLGDQCSDDNCENPFYCDGTKCAALGTAGSACNPLHAPCTAHLACIGGTCVPQLAEGATCNYAGGSELPCAAGSYCSPTTSKCTLYGLATAGGQCVSSLEEVTLCTGHSACMKDGGLTGTCVAMAADGERCSDTGGPYCISPANCISGLCTLPNAAACH